MIQLFLRSALKVLCCTLNGISTPICPLQTICSMLNDSGACIIDGHIRALSPLLQLKHVNLNIIFLTRPDWKGTSSLTLIAKKIPRISITAGASSWTEGVFCFCRALCLRLKAGDVLPRGVLAWGEALLSDRGGLWGIKASRCRGSAVICSKWCIRTLT